jgi:hypothetical protein
LQINNHPNIQIPYWEALAWNDDFLGYAACSQGLAGGQTLSGGIFSGNRLISRFQNLLKGCELWAWRLTNRSTLQGMLLE